MTAEKQETMILISAEGFKIGACVHYPVLGGWKFIPNTTSRKTSRKAWPTCNKCIPDWAFDASDEMLTASEFSTRHAGKVAA